ncbi:MAG: polysaccharide biosynthesis C-terminal domain-containing protein [Chloroflexota bacterium]|nr:polysaccharide biosynthesis C-terminal domain-containing protein [Chloroflexota bacterium]
METSGLKEATPGGVQGYLPALRNLAKSSAIYALGSIGAPLISLVLAPFITQHLSVADYGVLAVLVTFIGLGAGVTQLGLNSAFFRTYNFDFTSAADRRSILATVYILLLLAAIPLIIVTFMLPDAVSTLLLGRASFARLIPLVAMSILLQNLTVPVLAWLRAENRALLFTITSISNLVVNAIVTIVCIGLLHLGIAGALVGMMSGSACIVICTGPLILWYSRIKLRLDIARNLLAFGLPLVASFLASWVLQLSDRFLLSHLGTYAETASYAVAYNLGSVISTLIIGPFTLAWPTAMFTIARERDAAQTFKMVFRWFGFLLLVAAFALSLAATAVLYVFFPTSYHSAALVIPVVAESIAFSGIYYMFMVGANIKRKTWLTAIFTAVAASANFGLNLVLIPAYGAMGAAIATFVAYALLTLLAYIVNQRIYPIPFEVGRFLVALLAGCCIYGTCYFITANVRGLWIGLLWACGFLTYLLLLILLGRINVLRIFRHNDGHFPLPRRDSAQ